MKRRAFNRYAIAVAALASFLGFGQPTEAKVVYTAVNVTLTVNGTGNGHIGIDLNHDGKNDFTVKAVTTFYRCFPLGEVFDGVLTVLPTTGNGVVAIAGDADNLRSGVLIGSGQSFYKAQALMTHVDIGGGPPPCGFVRNSSGYWCGFAPTMPWHCGATGYLGLVFQINGQTHYGWALMSVSARLGTLRTTLAGFAYETIPGQAITTGQTSGVAEGAPTASPDSANPGDFGPTAS